VDGSNRNGKKAIGLWNPVRLIEAGWRIDDHCTITQTEIIAIKECALECLRHGLKGTEVIILSDSLSALRAIDSFQIFTKIVDECVKTLNKLGATNRVTIAWVPSHSGVEGNETADRIARKHCNDINVCPTLACNIDKIPKIIEEGCLKRAKGKWLDKKKEYAHANIFIKGYDEVLTNKLVRGSRAKLRTLTCLYSGHGPTNSFLKTFGKVQSDNCRFCKSSRETMYHLIQCCPYHASIRERLLGKDRDPTECEIIELPPDSLWKYALETRIYNIIMHPPKEVSI
jgi:hypothetical protein